MVKVFVIKYEDGKDYEYYATMEEAKAELNEAIESMDGDNWCGLHIEEEELDEETAICYF